MVRKSFLLSLAVLVVCVPTRHYLTRPSWRLRQSIRFVCLRWQCVPTDKEETAETSSIKTKRF